VTSLKKKKFNVERTLQYFLERPKNFINME